MSRPDPRDNGRRPTKQSKAKPAIDREQIGRAVRDRILDAKEKHGQRLPEPSTPRLWAMHLQWHVDALAEIARRILEKPSKAELLKLRAANEEHLTQIAVWALEGLEEIELRKQDA